MRNRNPVGTTDRRSWAMVRGIVLIAALAAACSVQLGERVTWPPLVPEPGSESAYDLRADAWLRACAEVQCEDLNVFGYVETPVPVRQRIAQRLGSEITFQTASDGQAMLRNGSIPEGWIQIGEGAPYVYADGVLAVNVASTRTPTLGTTKPYLYVWNGIEWIPATEDDARVATTIAVG